MLLNKTVIMLTWCKMSDCEDRLCLINNIMAEFYDYMYWTHLTKVAEWFTGSGSKVIELAYGHIK